MQQAPRLMILYGEWVASAPWNADAVKENVYGKLCDDGDDEGDDDGDGDGDGDDDDDDDDDDDGGGGDDRMVERNERKGQSVERRTSRTEDLRLVSSPSSPLLPPPSRSSRKPPSSSSSVQDSVSFPPSLSLS